MNNEIINGQNSVATSANRSDFKNLFENSEPIFTNIDRNEFKVMFRSNVNGFKKMTGCSTAAAITATIGWICFADSQEMQQPFSHTFLYNGNPVLVIFGDENGENGPVDLRIDFNFFERVIGYKRKDMLDAMRNYLQAKDIIASGMFA